MGKTKEKTKAKKSAKVLLGPLPTPLGDDAQRAWGALLRAHAGCVERIVRRTKTKDGLSLEAYDALLALSYAPGGRLRMGALYDAVTLSRSGLTRLIDRLEAQGYVRREVCPQDRRSFEAILTKAGEAERQRAWPLYARAIAEEFGRFFSDEEARALAALLEKTLEGVSAPHELIAPPA